MKIKHLNKMLRRKKTKDR